jgi:hypothetical protein
MKVPSVKRLKRNPSGKSLFGVCDPSRPVNLYCVSVTAIVLFILGTADAKQPFCGLYVAPSSLPGAGLGIYSRIDHEIGTVVGEGDVCIPIIDLWFTSEEDQLNDYTWDGDGLGMSIESKFDRSVSAICPGLDTMTNCHLGLINMEKTIPAYHEFSTAVGARVTNSGTGAVTPYRNGTTSTKRFVPAGSELFKDYGDAWFTAREAFPIEFPLSADYRQPQIC